MLIRLANDHILCYYVLELCVAPSFLVLAVLIRFALCSFSLCFSLALDCLGTCQPLPNEEVTRSQKQQHKALTTYGAIGRIGCEWGGWVDDLQ